MKGIPYKNCFLIKWHLSLSIFRGFLNFILVLSFLTSYLFLKHNCLSIIIISGSFSAALNLLKSGSFWQRNMSLMWYDLVSFILFLFSTFIEFVLQISFDAHSTSISSTKKEPRMMGDVGSLNTTSTSSLKRSTSRPFLKVRDISSVTWQGISISPWKKVIFCSEMMWKQTKSLLCCLIWTLELEKTRLVDDLQSYHLLCMF